MPRNNGSIKLTISEFANAIGKTAAWVNVYINRGKINRENGLIDIKDLHNEKFINQKNIDFDINRINGPSLDKSISQSNGKSKGNGNGEPKSNNTAAGNDEIDTLDLQKKKAELKRLKAQTRNEEIKAAKNEGKLIPIQEVETLFIYAIEGFHNYYQQEIDSILTTITGTIDLSHDRFVELRKDIKNTLTTLYNDTRKQLLEGTENLADQYSEVRGKGEHK